MVSTVQMMTSFLEKYGPVTDHDSLFIALREFLAVKVREHSERHFKTENELIGLAWNLEYTDTFHGTITAINDNYHLARGQPIQFPEGYLGQLWFRTKHDMIKYHAPQTLFYGSMVHPTVGGYSTWNGPWQGLGESTLILEQGVPHEDRIPLAVYAFQCRFFISDFPDYAEQMIMDKLDDLSPRRRIEKQWHAIDQFKRDEAYLDYLTNYKKTN